MTRYLVRYSPRAAADLQSAFDWGINNWSREEAEKWSLKFEKLIFKRLSSSPMAYPVAPESKNYPLEVRHLVIARYRVLFNIESESVFVLHIRGPFSGDRPEIEGYDAP